MLAFTLLWTEPLGELQPTSGWDRFVSLEHPSKFQRLSRLACVTAATSLTGGQPNFARCLAVFWDSTLHFRGLLPLAEFCPVQNSLRPSLAFYIDSVTAQHSNSGRQPSFVGWYTEWNYGTFAEGATYIRLGSHHVWYLPTFHARSVKLRYAKLCQTQNVAGCWQAIVLKVELITALSLIW